MKRSIKFSRKGNSTYAYEDWVINPTEGDDRAPGYTWVVFNSLFRDGNSYENFFGSLNAAKNFVETKEKGAGARVVDPVVHVGNLSVVADGNLPNSVARLIPARWGNATLDDWKPFIEAAKAKGIFK